MGTNGPWGICRTFLGGPQEVTHAFYYGCRVDFQVENLQLIGFKFSTFDLYDDVIFWSTLDCNEYIPRHQKLTPLWGWWGKIADSWNYFTVHPKHATNSYMTMPLHHFEGTCFVIMSMRITWKGFSTASRKNEEKNASWAYPAVYPALLAC